MSDYYTVQELAQKGGVSDRYIAKLCRQGKLAAEKKGRDWIISKAAGDAWLAGRRKK